MVRIATPSACALLLLAAATAASGEMASSMRGGGGGSGFSLSQLDIGVFADVDVTAKPREGENAAAELGGLDLYMTGQLSEHWSALAELVFEQLDGELVTDLERLQVSYSRRQLLRLTVGRVHNPLVKWNIDHHHGAYLQTTIDKPELSNWEDEPGLWPVHFVGVVASGATSGETRFSYQVGLGNGRGEILDEVQTTGDRNSSKAGVVRLGLSPAGAPGLEISAAGYFDEIPAASGPLDETDYSLAVVYENHGYELRSEWSRMQHDPQVPGPGFETSGWYVLFSATVFDRWPALRPYLFVDRLDVDPAEAFLEGVQDVEAWVVGMRWDIGGSTAIKADFRSETVGGSLDNDLVRIQLAVAL